ncbi:hypothetical protein BDY21DRAFT_291302, partial [Lineolata rhizophorae]
MPPPKRNRFKSKSKSISQSPAKGLSPALTPHEEVVGGEVTVKLSPGRAPKLSRTGTHKVVSKPAQLFLDVPNKTEEAKASFQVIPACTYAARYLGYTEHALECDCAEEWDSTSKRNRACGEDSDCINRATKMECVGECSCGTECMNQRFQRREYAKVSVFKTEKKGYGLRADANLRPNDFVFEYIGEVINENAFRRRMRQYDEEGIKHFYFMSLSKGEFVDATKKGNLGRFCNHSCNPNCYVDKWVVGDKLRMGIFAERKIKAGEELVFNYNVDRYGADPQPCYCGEPNCTGFIGGKTQTDSGTKLSNLFVEALGIDDDEAWEEVVAKRPRKRKTGEYDEEYVDSVQPKSLDEGGVTTVMASLMQCKEKWIAVKLLNRIQRAQDERVRNRVVKMHGYQILKATLNQWLDDHNVVLQILDILDNLPRITRNKIQDSKIEETVEKLKSCGDERIEKKAGEILGVWSLLEVGYRIPRRKRDPNETSTNMNSFFQRERQQSRSHTRSKSPEAPKAPSGPRNSVPQRHASYKAPRRRIQQADLPPGWYVAYDGHRPYFYDAIGVCTWTFPTGPPPLVPLTPPKAPLEAKRLQKIIEEITSKRATPNEQQRGQSSASTTPKTAQEPKKDKRLEKWRSYPEEKKKKVYENTLFPHIKYVMDKFKTKLPRDDLKRFAKEVSKKLVNSDFKNGRVEDPTKISTKQEKQVKKFVKEYFEKAVAKKREHDRLRAEKEAKRA